MKLRANIVVTLSALALLTVTLVGCYQGKPSRRPPIHVNPNMDWQPKVEAQEASDFFADRRGMRRPIEGTVARGELRLDKAYYEGRDARDSLVDENPVPISMELVRRGQERYGIYCTPCHGAVGDGKGIVATKEGMVPPASFHIERLREVSDGHIYDVITNGLRNMPSYEHQITVYDRWAIVAYVRALQLSQNAKENVVPEERRVTTQ